MSAWAAASAAVVAVAPGVRTSTMSAIFAGAGDQHAVAGGERQTAEHGAELAGAEDADGAHTAATSAPRSSRTIGMTSVPYSSTARRRALAGCAPTV
jgi:hypothetical protein